MNFSAVNIELASKVGDPVPSADANGKLLSAQERDAYVRNAFMDTFNLLAGILRDRKLLSLFPDSIVMIGQEKEGKESLVVPIKDFVPADVVDSKGSVLAFYSPKEKLKGHRRDAFLEGEYWTIEGGNIVVVSKNAPVRVIGYKEKPTIGFGIVKTITLNLAISYAMADLERGDKSSLYLNRASQYVKLLYEGEQLAQQRDE